MLTQASERVRKQNIKSVCGLLLALFIKVLRKKKEMKLGKYWINSAELMRIERLQNVGPWPVKKINCKNGLTSQLLSICTSFAM